MVRLRAAQRPGRPTLTLLATALTAAVALSACGMADGTARPTLAADPQARSEAPASAGTATGSDGSDGSGSGGSGSGSDPGSDPGGSDSPSPTTPARLEDFVRTSSTTDTEDLIGGQSLAAVDDGLAGTGSEGTGPGADDDGSGLLIESMILAEAAPSGFEGMTAINDPSVDRFLTIDEAAAIQPDPTEELALLETRGYRGGWIRAFRTEGGDVAVASVYRFGNATEAEFYLEDGLITIGGYGGEFFDIPDMDGVRGFRQDTAVGDGTLRSLGAAFQRDDHWFLLYIVGSPDTVTPDLLVGSLRSWRSELGISP